MELKKEDKVRLKLLKEINNCIGFKIANFKNLTINIKEKQELFEALGYLNLLNYSKILPSEVKRIWDKTNLKYV